VNRLTIAVEALRACAEVGLNVADDIAVVGCDDKMFVGLLSPPSGARRKHRIRNPQDES
jgi:DNA-binding LacI/PurR family transcriptional regulator